jgi:tetratricopeptide (TPR) repeat protein
MNTISIANRLLPILFTTLALGTCPVWSQDDEKTELTLDATSRPQDVRTYKRTIEAIESSKGAYANDLSEPLLGLALTLQKQGRHVEAIELFRRGIHLTRVNEGLYCPQQIPMLQGEISSNLAIQDYAMADDRQKYLYRVQTHSMESGDSLTDAYMQQAQWQHDAYQLGVGPEGYIRVMNMWELYQLALNDVIEREGKNSPKLIPPLQGMLQTQYLISGYEWHEPDLLFGEEAHPSEAELMFKSYRAKSYRQGNAIIEAIASIKQDTAEDKLTLAETLVMLGDWRLWNGRTQDAWQAYQEAERELAREDDAQLQLQQLFGEPVALPHFANLNPLPPMVDPQVADILLAFGVSERGRVQDLERMDDNEAEDRQAYQLMRQLRKTTFRPRFAKGQPLETEHIVKAFSIQ